MGRDKCFASSVDATHLKNKPGINKWEKKMLYVVTFKMYLFYLAILMAHRYHLAT